MERTESCIMIDHIDASGFISEKMPSLTVTDGVNVYKLVAEGYYKKCFLQQDDGLKELFSYECGSSKLEYFLRDYVFKERRLRLLSFEYKSTVYEGTALPDVLSEISRYLVSMKTILNEYPDADMFVLNVHTWYPGANTLGNYDFKELSREGMTPCFFSEEERELLKDSFISVELNNYSCCCFNENGDMLSYKFRMDENSKKWLSSFLELYGMYPFQDMILYAEGNEIMCTITHEYMYGIFIHPK